VPASAVSVIAGWADALRTGHPQRAAAYWAHPSAMVNGPDASGHVALIRIHTTHDALGADETLPCGATLLATSRNGPYIHADFALAARAGAGSSGCSGPAAVDFLIDGGHIVRWLRAGLLPSAPGGGGSNVEAPGATSA
jgi:hypothetical protein